VTTKTAYHVGLVVEMVGDVLVLEQTIPWNANCAQMDQKAALSVKPREISTLGELNTRGQSKFIYAQASAEGTPGKGRAVHCQNGTAQFVFLC
jgi:hypothetical protein